jgi:hypothetical protein
MTRRVRTLYVASKARHWPFWAALRSAGINIISRWIDWPANLTGVEPTQEQWSEHWTRCIREAASAEICIVLLRAGEQHAGALLEAGAALAAGRRVYMVDEIGFSFAHHPSVRRFATLAQAVEAVLHG